MKKSIKFLPLLSMGLVVVGCQDYDAGFKESDIVVKKYSNDFEQTFGNIPSDQNFNMAQQVSAKIDMSKYGDGDMKLIIFSKNPVQKGATILFSKTVSGKQEFSFDIEKGSTDVFVRVEKDGQRLVNDWMKVIGGVVSNEEMTTRAYTPAAGYDGSARLIAYDAETDCSTTIDKTNLIKMGTYNTNHYVHVAEIGSKDNKYVTENFTWDSNKANYRFTKLDNGNYWVVAPDDSEHTYSYEDGYEVAANKIYEVINNTKGAAYFDKGTILVDYQDPEDNWQWKKREAEGYTFYYQYKPAYDNYVYGAVDRPESFYHLNNVATNDKTIKLGDIIPILTCLDEGYGQFGYGYFAEQWDNRTIYKDKLNPDVEYVLGAEGPISFGMIYGATGNPNKLAYYYWFETGDPEVDAQRKLTAPRYILMEDARPNSNVKCAGESAAQMDSYIDALSEGSHLHADHDVVGTEYHLAYFGTDYNAATGSYNFPPNCHVSFVLINFQSSSQGLSSEDWSGLSSDKFYYGTQWMNKAIEHTYAATNGTNCRNHSDEHPYTDADNTIGEIAAVTYSLDGTIIAGFEDGVDMDVNDIMYYVKAPTISNKPKDIVNITTETHEWMVACEDLGGTFDYDFNDIVFGVKHFSEATDIQRWDEDSQSYVPEHIDGDNYIVITPYAAGGTLKSYLYYGDECLGEVHALVDPANASTYESMKSGEMPILNAHSKGTPGSAISKTLAAGQTFTMSAAAGSQAIAGFSIHVVSEGYTDEAEAGSDANTAITVVQYNKSGEAPQMMVLPNGWLWPLETHGIGSAYPNFNNWAQDASLTQWNSVVDNSHIVH